MKEWKRKTVIFLITLFLTFIVILWGMARLEPVVVSFAEESFKKRTVSAISLSVDEVMSEGNIDYSTLVSLDTDSGGNVTRLSANTPEINILKSKVSLKILERLKSEVKSVRVPLGNLTGMLFLSGKGPFFEVRLVSVEGLSVETDSTFLSQGINQTRHTIELKLNIRMSIALFTKPRTFEVEDGIVIADTVIVGKVPNSYTDINKADGELIGDVVDFRAE